MKTLVLAGLMAAGKTTISYELEKRLTNATGDEICEKRKGYNQ